MALPVQRLRAASFPRRAGLRAFAAGVRLAAFAALRTSGLGFLRRRSFDSFVPFDSFGLGLAAQAICRRAQAAADPRGLDRWLTSRSQPESETDRESLRNHSADPGIAGLAANHKNAVIDPESHRSAERKLGADTEHDGR